MKIHFTKFAGQEVEILDYLSDDIVKFRFKNLDPNLKSEGWSTFLKLQERTGGRERKKLEQEMDFKGYRSRGSVDELLNINFDHCFNAEYFLTNGQKIVSVLKKENIFQLGTHDYGRFQGFFPPLSSFYCSRQGSSLVCSIIKPLACTFKYLMRTSQRLDNATHQAGALARAGLLIQKHFQIK